MKRVEVLLPQPPAKEAIRGIFQSDHFELSSGNHLVRDRKSRKQTKLVRIGDRYAFHNAEAKPALTSGDENKKRFD